MTNRIKPLDPTLLDSVTGGAMPGLLAGNDRGNILVSGDGNDAIDGRGGDDTIFGQEGHDLINGGDGDDLIAGGEGRDVLHGGAGEDRFSWLPGHGDDTIYGGHGQDTLWLNIHGWSAVALMETIELAEGSPPPSLLATPEGMAIDLTGVRGTIIIGGERITFEGLERLEWPTPNPVPLD